jgi:hypothetical protein
LPPSPFHHPREVAWLEWGPGLNAPRQQEVIYRGLDLTESREIDEPVLKVMERLRPHFELIKAVRFAHEGD